MANTNEKNNGIGRECHRMAAIDYRKKPGLIVTHANSYNKPFRKVLKSLNLFVMFSNMKTYLQVCRCFQQVF